LNLAAGGEDEFAAAVYEVFDHPKNHMPISRSYIERAHDWKNIAGLLGNDLVGVYPVIRGSG
jgi:hypothetical protein